MRRLVVIAATTCVGLVGACGHEEFEPPDRQLRVDEAEAVYATDLFDTITWQSDSLRAVEGNAVYAAKCRRCHGPLGRGGTEYALERDLEVPSLVEPDWRYTRLDSVRHRVFVGHALGMPTFGVAGITLREIDASSYYVLNILRPEVLGESGR